MVAVFGGIRWDVVGSGGAVGGILRYIVAFCKDYTVLVVFCSFLVVGSSGERRVGGGWAGGCTRRG